MRDSRHTRRTCGAVAARLIAALLVAPAPAAAVDPAVSQYSLNFPNAVGKSYPGADAPTANAAELNPFVRQALSDSKRTDGKALAALATAPELGASDRTSGPADEDSGDVEIGSGETPSVPTALSKAVDDAPVILGLLALLAVIASLGFLARARPAGKDT